MKKIVILCILIVAFLFMGAVSAAPSQNVYVNVSGSDSNTGDLGSPYSTIQKAINTSNENNSANIYLGPGTFAGVGNVNSTISKNNTSGGSLTFIGAGINKTYIDGGKTSWIFNIGSTSTVNLINITFINGQGSSGGAISNQGTLNINNCSFEANNATSSGGAIYSSSGSLNVSNLYFNNNYAKSSGGAIYAYAGNSICNIINSVFGNSSSGTNGGAIYISGSSSNYSSIMNSSFYDSTAVQTGGSLYVTYTSIINNYFENSVTTSTTSTYGGGAIFGSNIYLENNSMILCSAASGNGNYIKVNGLVKNSFVTINDNSITSPTFSVTGSVADDKGNSIDGLSLSIYANSTLLGTGNVVNGAFTLTTSTLLDNGVYILNGASNYFSNITNGTLNVNINRNPATYYVSPTGNDIDNDGLTVDTPFATIQHGIATGFANNTNIYVNIYLLDGIYSGTGNVNVTLANYLGYLTLAGLNYGQAIIDGNGTNWAFNFGYNVQATLTNLTIRNCSSGSNTGVIVSTGTNMGSTIAKYKNIAINNCIIQDNIAKSSTYVVKLVSGSVENSIFDHNAGTPLYITTEYIENVPVLVNNCSFTNNYNLSNPYGVILLGNTAVLENSLFVNNSGSSSWGLINFQYYSEVRNNRFINNTNPYNGGMILDDQSSTITSFLNVNNTFEGNSASYIVGGGGTFINNTFRNNTLTQTNRAIFYLSQAYDILNISDCNFTNNSNLNSIVYMATRGTILNDGVLIFESNNSNSLSNVLKAYLDLNGITVSGGAVSFYLNGTLLGTTSFVNNVATMNVSGFGNGIYQITGNSSNLPNAIVQNGVLNISKDSFKDSLILYVGENGNDATGNGSIDAPFATIKKAIDTGVLNTVNLTIFILPGTIKGTGNANLTLPNYLNLTITGIYNRSIIDGEATNWIFSTSTLYDTLSDTFSNLTIRNAKGINVTSSSGTANAGIVRIGGFGIIDNCIFENNKGVSVSLENNGNLIINNSIFRANYGTNYGTCVLASSATSTLKIYDTIFENNTATVGGAAVFLNGLNNTIISGCTLKDLIISNNITFNSGGQGAILWRGSTAGKIISISDCYFTNNTLDLHHTWDTGQNAIRPTIKLINCTFNSSGGITGGSGNSAYYEALWEVINSSFINMQCDKIFRTEDPAGNHLNTVDFYYLSFIGSPGSIIQGCLFENTTGVIFGGSFNITDSVILNQVTLMKAWTNAAVTMNLNNNYWGFNNPYDSFVKIEQYGNNQYKVNTILDQWIVPKLVADGKAGLSQVISLVYMAFDGTDYYDYDVRSIPIPDEEFAYVVINGTITPGSGNLTNSGVNAIYKVDNYGIDTILANFTNGNSLSLVVNFHTDATKTTVSLSKSGGENGEYVDVTVTVTGEDGSHVNEGTVEFFLNGNSIGTVDVINGTATKTVQIKGPNGPNEIYADYLGTETLNESNDAKVYELQTTAPNVSINRAGDNYTSIQNVTLISDDPNAIIYYTLDGSNPTTNSTKYLGSILLNSSKTLKYFAVDLYGNPSQIYTQKYTIDTVAPTVTKLDPAKNATVKVSKAITITFSEVIKAGSLAFDLKNSSNISVPFNYSINASTLTITPKTALGNGKYSLVLNAGAVTDLLGNSLGLYSTSFSVDAVVPKVSKIDPANGATLVVAGKTIKITFSEAVKAGSKVWIELTNSAGKAVSFKYKISGNTLTVDPNSNLAESKYKLTLHSGAVTDLSGNFVAAFSSYFSVGTAPKVSKIDPVNGATLVSAGKTIKITFNEAIKAGSKVWVELKNSSNKAVAFKYTISGKILTIDPTKNLAESKYTLVLHSGAVTDLAGNALAAKSSTFTVGTAPKVSKIDPANSATKVTRSKTIKVTFNENIKAASGSKYWIELKTSSGKEVKISKSISGKVLSITHAKLAANTKYQLIIHGGAVTDKAGNPVAAKTYKFTTGNT